MAKETKRNARNSEMETDYRENQVVKPLDLTFHNLSFTTAAKKTKAKTILHKTNGAFKSGQLTAILGPSGAGKTTLMNILAGLKTSGVEGRININGETRDLREFRKKSAYITQKDYLLPHLTVEEYMLSAAHLKLGNQVAFKQKELIIENVLKTLRLTETKKTRVSCLSGGECKRLSIALELIGNPTVLFLDEPTSGLDSSSCLQCVRLLQDIARSGRTVIATFHQPSSRLLDHFDLLYIVTDGSCVYQGPVKSLVSYFKLLNLNCPSFHNPADFAIDVACGEYGNVHQSLVDAIDNGRIIYTETTSSTIDPILGCVDEDIEETNPRAMKKLNFSETYAAPFHTQIFVLLVRTWRCELREKVLSWLRFLMFVIVGFFMGIVYWQTGDEAINVIYNTSFLFFALTFTVFAAGMPTVITFPLERKTLVREHLNNWYSLKAYYMAKVLVNIPLQFICPTAFLIIVYPMTNQPKDIERFFMLLIILIEVAFIGQCIGLLTGALFSMRVAVFVAPVMALPFVILCGYLIRFSAMPTFVSWLTYSSFMRYAFEGSMVTIYGNDRPPLNCSQSYCMFRHSEYFLEQFDMTESSYLWSIVAMLVIIVVLKFTAYFVLRAKLRQAK